MRKEPSPDPDWSKFQNPKMRDFFRKGLESIRATKSPCTIKPGEPEFAAWVDYFDRHIGARPHVLKVVIDDRTGKLAFTVPAQWPEWFDTDYARRQ